MSTAARSLFTEAIEDHLALKKQNAALESTMPLARYDVGDPLDRFPGGPARAAGTDTVVVTDGDAPATDVADAMPAGDATQIFVGPSPEQAMEAATSLEPAFGDRPFEPLNGMAPMLSLVEDIEDDVASIEDFQPMEPAPADILRFPGGVGPREDESVAEVAPMQLEAFDAPMSTPLAAPANPMQPGSFDELDAPTGEQPVLVIDTTEPFASTDGEPPVASRSDARKRSRPRFFGLGRKKQDEAGADGWFTDGPRDFNWD